jgi:nucleoid-associated protein YgaU
LVGRSYKAISLNSQGLRWSEELGLYLGIYQGQLRYFTTDFQLIPTSAEAAVAEMRADAEAQRADVEAQRADAEAQRADVEAQRAESEAKKAAKLAEKLRELGIDPNQVEIGA